MERKELWGRLHLSGIDGQMIQARVRDERLGYVGEITKVDVRPILDVIDKGYIPCLLYTSDAADE